MSKEGIKCLNWKDHISLEHSTFGCIHCFEQLQNRLTGSEKLEKMYEKEIEQLQQENAEQKKAIDKLRDQGSDFAEEIRLLKIDRDRLREALEKILTHGDFHCIGCKYIHEIAQKAIGEDDEN